MLTSSTGASSSFSSSVTSSFTSSSYEDSSFSLSSSSIPQFSLEEINIATNNFDKKRILGAGGEATVYKAEVYLNSKTQKTWVAVKHLDKNSTEFMKEIQIVSKIQHPYLVSLHGYCNESGEKILIYEYMKNGCLSDYVRKNSKICLTWKQRLNICLGAAYGLQYLHKETTEFRKGIIHRDVKPANILLDENWVAKVSDFGMFKVSDSAQIQSTVMTNSRIGTQGYFAPEYFMSLRLSRKADVYAFGVVLFEVLCRKKLWDRGDVTYFGDENEDLGVWACENVDVEIKQHISSDSLMAFTDAIGKCLQQEPIKRPTMDSVVKSLKLAIKCQELQTEDLNKGLPILGPQDNLDALVKYISQEDIGFRRGKPVAAFTIYKSLVDQKTFEANKTSVFDRLSSMLISALKNEADNEHMAYWLCNASTLYFLVQRSIILPTARKTLPPTSFTQMFFQAFSQSPPPRANLDFPRYEAKYPALLFRQQLNAIVEKMCCIILGNFIEELSSPITLFIESSSIYEDSTPASYWKSVIKSLNGLLATLKKKYVQSTLVQKIFNHIFSYINAQIFNSILLHRKCCTLSYGKHVKKGLAELEFWCDQTTKEFLDSTWDELKHVRQAVEFLVIHEKSRISSDDLTKDLCPVLSGSQLFRICNMYNDAKYNTSSVSQEVGRDYNTVYSLRGVLMEEANSVGSNTYLLDDNYSINSFSLSGDEIISNFDQDEDFSYVKPDDKLLQNPTFQSLWLP